MKGLAGPPSLANLLPRAARRIASALGLSLAIAASAFGAKATLVFDPSLDPPARHGLATLEQALQEHGWETQVSVRVEVEDTDVLLLAGVGFGEGAALRMLKVLNVRPPTAPQGLVVRRAMIGEKPAVILWGSDMRGLMYAALDTADRVSRSDGPQDQDPFACVLDTVEAPFIRERAVSMYTMQRAWFERRLYDERHWEGYFDLLARSRITSFVVIFGYENGGFMAPPYPYFFDVEGFPRVELVGLGHEQQQRNTAAFRRMIEIAHARGVDVVVGIWDHIYRGGVQGGGIAGASEHAGHRVPGLVDGVTAENLIAYNQAALRKFLRVFSEIDGIQFRMHGESGLKRGEMPGFWHDIFAMVREMRPDLRVDLRAKELPDAIIEDGLDQGLSLRVATKYWMEQMGLPFHPTHINRPNQKDRRHGYADLLRYPQRYRIHWRLWNGGTTRVLLWADPAYVRRFAESARLYGGDSYEVNEMLATWMLGEPHDKPPLPLLNPEYRYYEYPFERYWHYYQVWGRVGYDPNVSSEVWEREFARRFGGAGDPLMRGLHLASQVLPRIVAASYRYRLFPTTRGWAEMMRVGDLPDYAKGEPSDIQQFLSPREEARRIVNDGDTAKRRPQETGRWFHAIADRILGHVSEAERRAGTLTGKEFMSTITDLKILAGLARYHANRLPAGVACGLFEETGDLFALDDAVRHEELAIKAWAELARCAGDVYSRELALGVHRVGFSRHWDEELDKLRQGYRRLLAWRDEQRSTGAEGGLSIAHVPVRRAVPGETLLLRATVGSPSGVREVIVRMLASGEAPTVARLEETAPKQYRAEIHLPPGECRYRYVIEAVDRAGARSVFPPEEETGGIELTSTSDRRPPEVRLERVNEACPGHEIEVSASVSDPSGVRWVRLRYRHATQFEDYETVEMVRDPVTGLYRGDIPGDFVVPEWDVMYFVEAVDRAGNGRMYPDLETETPYVVVQLDR